VLYNYCMDTYVSGAHNMKAEVAKERLKLGKRALLAALVFVVAVFVLNLPQAFMLVVGIPLFMGVRLVLEGTSRFSVTYGLHGLYDEGKGVKHTKEDEEIQQKDRTKAQSILFFSTLAGVMGALFCYVVLV